MPSRRKPSEGTASKEKQTPPTKATPPGEVKKRHNFYLRKEADDILTTEAKRLYYRDLPQFCSALLEGIANRLTSGELKVGNPLLMYMPPPPPMMIQQALPGMAEPSSPVQDVKEEEKQDPNTYKKMRKKLLATEEEET